MKVALTPKLVQTSPPFEVLAALCFVSERFVLAFGCDGCLHPHLPKLLSAQCYIGVVALDQLLLHSSSARKARRGQWIAKGCEELIAAVDTERGSTQASRPQQLEECMGHSTGTYKNKFPPPLIVYVPFLSLLFQRPVSFIVLLTALSDFTVPCRFLVRVCRGALPPPLYDIQIRTKWPVHFEANSSPHCRDPLRRGAQCAPELQEG